MLPVGIPVVAAVPVRLVVIARVAAAIITVKIFEIIVVLLLLPASVAVRRWLSMATRRMLAVVVPHIVGVIHIA